MKKSKLLVERSDAAAKISAVWWRGRAKETQREALVARNSRSGKWKNRLSRDLNF